MGFESTSTCADIVGLPTLILPHGPRPVVSHDFLYKGCEAIIAELMMNYSYTYLPSSTSCKPSQLDLTGTYVSDRDLIRFRVVLHDSVLHKDIWDIDVATIPYCSTEDSDKPVITFRPAFCVDDDFSHYVRKLFADAPYNVIIAEKFFLTIPTTATVTGSGASSSSTGGASGVSSATGSTGATSTTGASSSAPIPTSITTGVTTPIYSEFSVSKLSLCHKLRIGQNGDELDNCPDSPTSADGSPNGSGSNSPMSSTAMPKEVEPVVYSDQCIQDLHKKVVTIIDAWNENVQCTITSSIDITGVTASSPLNHQITETQLFVDDVVSDLKAGRVIGNKLTVVVSPVWMKKVHDIPTLLWQQTIIATEIANLQAAAVPDTTQIAMLQEQMAAKVALSGTADPITGVLTGGSVVANELLSLQFTDATSAEEAAAKEGRPGSWILRTYVPLRYTQWFAFAVEMTYNSDLDAFDFGKSKIYHNESEPEIQDKLAIICNQVSEFLCSATGCEILNQQTATC
jgi:hypothetical protein